MITETSRADEFVSRTVRLLDEAAERTAPEDLVRLRMARERALVPRRSWLPQWSWPTAAVALATVAVAVVAVRVMLPSSVPERVPGLQHLELLASADSLEFYEDLEFLQWLEASRNE